MLKIIKDQLECNPHINDNKILTNVLVNIFKFMFQLTNVHNQMLKNKYKISSFSLLPQPMIITRQMKTDKFMGVKDYRLGWKNPTSQ